MEKSNYSKKSQVTIFIIVGIMLVALLLAFFLFRGGISSIQGGGAIEENPESFMASCLEPKLNEIVDILSKQGGHLQNDLSINFQFKDEEEADISYLCYNQNYYFPRF